MSASTTALSGSMSPVVTSWTRAWLVSRSPTQAAVELIAAAAGGTPGLRGAAFAVLDRIGTPAAAEVRAAMAEPLPGQSLLPLKTAFGAAQSNSSVHWAEAGPVVLTQAARALARLSTVCWASGWLAGLGTLQ